MEKSNKFLIVAIVILSVLLVGVSGYVVYDKFLSTENVKEENIQNDNKNDNETVVDKNNYVGIYTFKYNDKASDDIKDNEESTLILKSDSTFYFEWNACSGMIGTTGNYNINNNKIVLSNLKSNYQEMLDTNLQGRKNLEFTIVTENEIYLNLDEDMACTVAGNQYGLFVKTVINSDSNFDLNTYAGEWFESVAHANDSNPNFLNIKTSNNKLVIKELYFTRTAGFDNFEVSLNNGIGTFDIISDNGLSIDNNPPKITGTIALSNNTIKVLIEKSNITDLEAHTVYTFIYKK